MRILILGVGDAFTRNAFGSSALVEAPQGFVLIDCPDPIHRVLHEASVKSGWNADVASVNDIVITHLHGDHCNGLESFGFYRRIMRLNNQAPMRPRLHVAQPVADRVWEKLAPAMDTPFGGFDKSDLDDFFDVRIIDPDAPATIAGLTVRSRYTKHPVPTIGLVLSDGRHSFGWSADTPFEQAHIDWLNQADVFVHESNLGVSHTPIESLNALPEAVRRKIRLIHLPDDFDRARTDMAIVREGDVISV